MSSEGRTSDVNSRFDEFAVFLAKRAQKHAHTHTHTLHVKEITMSSFP